MHGMAPPLAVQLEDSQKYRELVLHEPLDPRSWQAVAMHGQEHLLFGNPNAVLFFKDLERSLHAKLDKILISVSQDEAGQHQFVNMGDAVRTLEEANVPDYEAGLLTLTLEDEAKRIEAREEGVLLYARVESALVEPSIELCPHGWASNYSVVPELSLGRTQKLILSDEATLRRVLPDERIFEHLRLIVNCHEHSAEASKYKIGSCSSRDQRPQIICQAVHDWFRLDATTMNAANDQIQETIWKALQSGSVAVHCLAGIHRAACIVACHFLWRHYTLKHTNVTCNTEEIYRRLIAVRPNVSPAYAHVLRQYELYLKAGKAAGPRSLLPS